MLPFDENGKPSMVPTNSLPALMQLVGPMQQHTEQLCVAKCNGQ